jgi:hypothetical protein
VWVQRKNNRSGVLIEQSGGFAISTRNAAGGPGFAFAASAQGEADPGTLETKNSGDNQHRRMLFAYQ